MHFFLWFTDSIVVLHSFQSNLLAQLLLEHIIDVKLNYIFADLFIELNKLFLHCSWTCNNIWPTFFTDFEDLSQNYFILVINFVNLIDGNELAVFQPKISSLVSVREWFWHCDNDVSGLMLFFIQSTNLELKFFWVDGVTELRISLKYSMKLILQNICLHNNNSLRFENLIFGDFAFAWLTHSYKVLS